MGLVIHFCNSCGCYVQAKKLLFQLHFKICFAVQLYCLQNTGAIHAVGLGS